eukprot:CAMPEP_0198150216 /NCGR_PEP_ID=MMETSP1443-20131203/49969_1 /TAXON_ID=186043 /ORGANISM="Entomoneis sp., Strain CCMP2396" /LENGTH=443 /DNA_ID=CAMNT_0043815469 /DNA_START=61 /DNA_END=1392 /DNA_ORIENTATION=-
MSSEEAPKDLKSSARRQSSIINASTTAAASKQSAKAKDTSDYVKITKAILDFEILTLQAKKQLLEDLSLMSDDEKKETLFLLLDKDMDGSLDAVELADGLRKVRGDVSFEESLAIAVERVLQFDKEGEGKLSLEDFGSFVETLSEALGASFHELSELLVMQVMFAEGNTDMEDLAGAIVEDQVTEAIKEEEVALKAIADKRMKVLFHLFDADHSGRVDFKEVVVGMFKITEDAAGASKAALMALLMFDENSDRSLDYEEFARFMITIVAASSQSATFDDVADAMTLLAGQEVQLAPEEIKSLYELNESVQTLLSIKEEQEILENVSESQLTKAGSLFFMWDLDEDGVISIQELILGLRKFEQTDSLKVTVDEAIGLMETYDVDGDHNLSPTEFCLFMVQFAELAGAGLDDTLDFMIATSALETNSEAEVKFLRALTDGDIYHL